MTKGCTFEEKLQLEKKISTLEQRLVLVERFVEMRFCESFRDFSIRNHSQAPLRTESNYQVESTSVKLSHIEPRPKVGRKPKQSGRLTTILNETTTPEPKPEDEEPDETEIDEEPTTYRTRSGRKTKRLTATALGIARNVKDTPKTTEPMSPIKTKGHRGGAKDKILKVSLTRLPALETNAAEVEEVDTSIVKLAQSDNEMEGLNDETTDYFTYPTGNEVGVDEQAESEDGHEVGEHLDDGDWNASDEDMSETEGKPTSTKAKSRRKRTTQLESSPSDSVKRSRRGRVGSETKAKIWPPSKLDMLSDGVQLQMLNPNESNLKECPICRKHLKPQAYDSHVEWHGKERHLKCSVCDKRFFSDLILRRHKRIHQLEKYGKKCRLCGKVSTDSYKQLKHEGYCIKKRLEAHIPVPSEIMEDVRKRSTHLELKWPDPNAEQAPDGMKKCKYCNEYIPEKGFNAHIKEQHAQWQCHLCENKYVEKGGLVRHLLHSHGQCSKLTCDRCDSEFGTTEEYKEHAVICRQENKKPSGAGTEEEHLLPPEQVEEERTLITTTSATEMEGIEIATLEIVTIPPEATPIVIQEFIV